MPTPGAIRAGQAYVEATMDSSKLQAGLNNAQTKLKSFGQTVGMIGKDMALFGGIATAGFAMAEKRFIAFDDTMRAVAAIAGATGAQFTALTAKAAELGRVTSFTADQVANAMLELGRAGFAPTEIDAAIGSILNLARATKTELPEAANIAAGALRAFDLEAGEMTRVADVMTATANNSAQTLTDLAEAMTYAAPIASSYGMTLEETSKIIGSLANFSIRGSMAGNTLKNIMLQLANASVRDKLAGLGVATQDAAGNLLEVSSVLRSLGAAIRNIPQADRLSLMNDLFGKRAVVGGVKLTAAAFEKLNTSIDNAGGTSARVAKEMDAGAGGAMRRLTSAAEGAAIGIGEALAPAVSRLAEIITKAATSVTPWIAAHKEIIVTAAAIAASLLAIGTTLLVMKQVSSVIIGVIFVVKGLIAAFSVLMAHPVVAVIVGIAAAAIAASAAIASLTGYTAKLSDRMQKVYDAGQKQRSTDQKTIARLQQLADKGKLTNQGMEEAERRIASLERRYGPLGITIDKTTGKFIGLAEGIERANDAADLKQLRELNDLIDDEKNNLLELSKAREGLINEWRVFGSESGRIQDIKDLSDKESELADKLKALYHERDVLTGTDTSKELDVALASGAADQSAAESEQEAAASWARKLAQLRIALIDDEHERRMATIKEEYDAEIASARESAASQATLNAIEQGRALAIEAAQRDVAKRQAEQAKQEAEDRAAFLDSAAIADADRLYEIKRLELEATKDGYDLQVSLLALEEERATLMAKAAGENLAYVEREFAIRRQLLNQTDTNVGGGAQARGLFNVAARLSLEGGGMQDRIAKATAETAKNTARMVYEFQATQSVYGN